MLWVMSYAMSAKQRKTIRAHDLMEVNCIAHITVRVWSAQGKNIYISDVFLKLSLILLILGLLRSEEPRGVHFHLRSKLTFLRKHC